MKRALIVLTMLLIAATSYNQTSRRTVNANGSATRTAEKSTETKTRSASTRASDDQKNNTQAQSRVNNNTQSQRAVVPDNKGYTRDNSNNNNGNRNVNNGNRDGNQNVNTDNRSNDRNGNHQVNNGNHNGDRNGNHNGNRSYEANHDQGKVYDNHNNRGSGHAQKTVDARHHNNDVYVNYPSSRHYHGAHKPRHTYVETPHNRDYRAVHYRYREPVHVNIYWTREMHRHYIEMYPEVRYWHYNIGYRINATSAYYADYYIGEVMNVYGMVSDVFYSMETDEYFLYFGAYYPYHDFTIVLPGHIARSYSRMPEYFFNNQYINVTGLITAFDGKPEIVVKRNYQLNVY